MNDITELILIIYNLLLSQLSPVELNGQTHVYELIWSMQLAVTGHGAVAQSSTLFSQFSPVKPMKSNIKK